MTPEAKARQQIEQRLAQAGWVIQDQGRHDLSAALGVAIREYSTGTGPADYLLFVQREPVGVIEAKRDNAGANLTVAEAQTERYAAAPLKWLADRPPLRFRFEATGQIIRFTDQADPAPRSREVFHFFSPATLAAWLAAPTTLRRRLAEQLPPLPETAQRQKILRVAFSGQLVPQDPADEPATVLLERIRAERAKPESPAKTRRAIKPRPPRGAS